MREQLRDISESDYWVYGLRIDDLDYILRLTRDFIEAKRTALEVQREQAIAQYPDPSIHGEIISDDAHYNWVDEQYLWQFCLWRFQGILEGLIAHRLLPGTDAFLPGLKAKLRAMQEAGYTLSETKHEELLRWANLRNALSHSPPEQYRPGPLCEGDILEYKELVEDLLSVWFSEQSKINGKKSEA